MPKNKVSEWSSTAANNTDIGSIDIAEGCAPSGINNAIREMMAQVKDMQAGTDADNFTVGGNLNVTGTTTATGAITANGGVTGNLTGNVTGNVTGNASTATALSGTLAIAGGGTGQTTASAAFDALKQSATDAATGVVELATDAEVITGTDTTRAVTPASMKAGLNATGTAPTYACRAWVNFDATKNAAGSVDASNTARFLKGSGNVTSVVKNSTGDYTITFTTALPDANFATSISLMGSTTTGSFEAHLKNGTTPTTTSVQIQTYFIGTSIFDPTIVSVSVFR